MSKKSWSYESHRPVVGGRQWAIVCGHPLASQAGAEVLAQGGHAEIGRAHV
jgi:gamma-glutamyltranspeptidase